MHVNKLISSLLIMTYFSLLCSCLSLKTNSSDFQISYVKSRGRQLKKPHFKIEIKGNSVYYTGIANMSVLGETSFKLSKSELKKITTVFKQGEFSQFKKKYITKYRDMALTIITYKNHEVRYQDVEAPKKLKDLALLLESCLPNDYK